MRNRPDRPAKPHTPVRFWSAPLSLPWPAGSRRAKPGSAPSRRPAPPSSGPCDPTLSHSHTGTERRARKPRASSRVPDRPPALPGRSPASTSLNRHTIDAVPYGPRRYADGGWRVELFSPPGWGVRGLLPRLVRLEADRTAPDVTVERMVHASARAEREAGGPGQRAGDALVPHARLPGGGRDAGAVADEVGVLEDVLALDDCEPRGDHGSEDCEPENHAFCIGSHEPAR